MRCFALLACEVCPRAAARAARSVPLGGLAVSLCCFSRDGGPKMTPSTRTKIRPPNCEGRQSAFTFLGPIFGHKMAPFLGPPCSRPPASTCASLPRRFLSQASQVLRTVHVLSTCFLCVRSSHDGDRAVCGAFPGRFPLCRVSRPWTHAMRCEPTAAGTPRAHLF